MPPTDPPPPYAEISDNTDKLVGLLSGLHIRPTPAPVQVFLPCLQLCRGHRHVYQTPTVTVRPTNPAGLRPGLKRPLRPKACLAHRRAGSFPSPSPAPRKAATQSFVVFKSVHFATGYRTLVEAQAAFKYAQERGWTRALAPDGSTTAQLAAPPTPANPLQGPNPLHAGPLVANGLWYIVYRGITPGVYTSSLNTQGLSAAVFDSCRGREEAEKLFRAAVTQNHVRDLFRSRLEELPLEEQQIFKARARDASARYRATRRQRERELAAALGVPPLSLTYMINLSPETWTPPLSRRHD
ncbi:hypothetical protein B0H16DRAFT_1481455 [Mycena metata]|uniref:Uncharacterized protein n=1 Tax=Mycena metata TaxID=1033252 RepID=A0AAD7GYH6_9AGAR|nr:hypothetical protein B0H16DRAFT_1481455 [Mycena metata]